MTATDLYPSGAVLDGAPASQIGRALAIRRQVMETEWPESRDAHASIRYGLRRLNDILAIRDRLLNDPGFDPYSVRAPEMGWWDDPEKNAREYLDGEALEAAKGCWRRLDEGLRREKNSSKGETG